VKISATLIDRCRYLREFSVIHSSTFAEDPVSCSVANKVLDLLERDRLLEMAEQKGSFLKTHFERLIRKYPRILRSLKGKGLMLGVEFCDQRDSSSALIREIEKAGRLAYFVAGYLFHQEKMRVLPTLSNPHVLRLEPSAYISYSDLRQVSDAFERLGEVLAKSNAHALLHYVVRDRSPVVFPVKDYSRERKSKRMETPHLKVGFLAHFIDEGQLKELEPSFEAFTSSEQDRFIRKMMAMAKPMHIASEEITSRTGKKISFNLIVLPVTSRHMVESLRTPKTSRALGMVKEAVRMACEMSCEIIGLGQYNSIISSNGLALTEPSIAITTGNSYTVAVSVQSVIRATEILGLDTSLSTISLVGAAGNIGTAYAMMIANRFPKIHLVGSPKEGSFERLQTVRSKMIQESYRRLVQHGASSDMLEGIGKRLLEIPQMKRLLDEKVDEQTALRIIHQSGALDDILSISTDLSSIHRSEIIVAVSNSDTRLIQTEWVKPNAIICDISVPCAASHEVIQNRKDVLYFTGGIVRLPHEEELDLPGFPLPPGHVFACMAETMILGLSGIRENFSYGKLKVRQIELIESLASYHGFGVSSLKPYPVSQWGIFTDQKKIDRNEEGSHGLSSSKEVEHARAHTDRHLPERDVSATSSGIQPPHLYECLLRNRYA
jgi:predicted amino acid dehydrogenase